jgi:hypothetical protein
MNSETSLIRTNRGRGSLNYDHFRIMEHTYVRKYFQVVVRKGANLFTVQQHG